MDAIAEIKKLYYAATKATIQNDLDRAIDLLKTLPSDDDRERVAVYMDGLAQMRSEWKQAMRGGVGASLLARDHPLPRARPAAPRGRSDRSTASSRRRSLSRCIMFSVSATGVFEFFTSASSTP